MPVMRGNRHRHRRPRVVRDRERTIVAPMPNPLRAATQFLASSASGRGY